LSIPRKDLSTGSGLPVAAVFEDGATAEKADTDLVNEARRRAAEKNFIFVAFVVNLFFVGNHEKNKQDSYEVCVDDRCVVVVGIPRNILFLFPSSFRCVSTRTRGGSSVGMPNQSNFNLVVCPAIHGEPFFEVSTYRISVMMNFTKKVGRPADVSWLARERSFGDLLSPSHQPTAFCFILWHLLALTAMTN
jgi:hypothetical protein